MPGRARIPRPLIWLLVPWVSTALSAAPPGERPAFYPDPERWEAAIQAFEKETRESPPPDGAVVFYGSSSIAGWHGTLQDDMAPLPVVGRGFGGSTLWDALHFLDRVVIPLHPAAVVLYEGDNDIGAHGAPPDLVFELFREFVEGVQRELPDTRVLFLSIKPCPSRWDSWPRMRALCSEDSLLGYIDVASPMLDDRGLPRPAIFLADSLHMNRRGYELWTEVVKGALAPAPRAR